MSGPAEKWLPYPGKMLIKLTPTVTHSHSQDTSIPPERELDRRDERGRERKREREKREEREREDVAVMWN